MYITVSFFSLVVLNSHIHVHIIFDDNSPTTSTKGEGEGEGDGETSIPVINDNNIILKPLHSFYTRVQLNVTGSTM